MRSNIFQNTHLKLQIGPRGTKKLRTTCSVVAGLCCVGWVVCFPIFCVGWMLREAPVDEEDIREDDCYPCYNWGSSWKCPSLFPQEQQMTHSTVVYYTMADEHMVVSSSNARDGFDTIIPFDWCGGYPMLGAHNRDCKTLLSRKDFCLRIRLPLNTDGSPMIPIMVVFHHLDVKDGLPVVTKPATLELIDGDLTCCFNWTRWYFQWRRRAR